MKCMKPGTYNVHHGQPEIEWIVDDRIPPNKIFAIDKSKFSEYYDSEFIKKED